MTASRFLDLFLRSFAYWATGRLKDPPCPSSPANDALKIDAHLKTGNAMNKSQRIILVSAALIILMMLSYPPFCISNGNYTADIAYSWLWLPPDSQHVVNAVLLLTQWAGVVLIAGLLVLAAWERR